MENRAIGMNENWVKWNPLKFPESRYYVTDFIQNADGTKIILNDEKNCVEVFFEGVTPLVRTSIEGIRMRTWGEVQEKYNNRFFFRNWFFYKVENSKLTDWVMEESCGFYKKYKFTHYCIVTSEDIIDIISDFEPTIKLIQGENQ